jgi:hypothetical protein
MSEFAENLRLKFKEKTGDNWLNSQDEPDIDYVQWLEELVETKSLQKLRYEEMYNEANDELIEAGLRKSAIRIDQSRGD